MARNERQAIPIGYGDGINWYDYVDGDPVNRSDPTGMICTGSLVENGNGTCAGTGGFTTGLDGAAQGTQIARAQAAANAARNPLERAADSVGEAIGNLGERLDNVGDRIKKIGEDGENQIREQLTKLGYRIAGEQVYVVSKLGLRVTDFLVLDKKGGLFGLEVKTNGGRYSETQMLKDASIARFGGRLSSGTNLSPLLQTQIGKTIQYQTLRVYLSSGL